jgi:hypothetical protein
MKARVLQRLWRMNRWQSSERRPQFMFPPLNRRQLPIQPRPRNRALHGGVGKQTEDENEEAQTILSIAGAKSNASNANA